MKKLIVILIMCLALCGCSKEEPTPTTTPTSEPTKEPTKEPTTAPTEAPTVTETPAEDIVEYHCQVCGVSSNEKPLSVCAKGDAKYILCDDCYLDIVKSDTDCQIFQNILGIVEIAFADAEVFKENKSLGTAYIKINESGLSYENAGEKLQEKVNSYLESMGVTEYPHQECLISITDGNLKTEKKPTNLLDTLESIEIQ